MGLFEIRSCLHPHHTSWSLPYAGPGQMGHHPPLLDCRTISRQTASFFRPPSEKKSLTVVFWQGFWMPHGIKYGAKNRSV
jgi:hypothetical protein